MQHLEEGTIHAWLDGELQSDKALALEAHIAECQECAAAVAEGRGLIAASSQIVSALDVIPADVIPIRESRKRAWYANTQLRAAAAVLIVAGASFLIVRQGEEPSVSRLMDQSIGATAVNADNAERLKKAPDDSALGGRVSGVALSPLSTRVANVPPVITTQSRMSLQAAAKQAPIADAGRPMDAARSDTSRSRAAIATMDELVVTGVASAAPMFDASALPVLRELKSDTVGNTIVTVYRVASGVEVTLSEIVAAGFAAPRREAAQLKAATGEAAPAPPVQAMLSARTDSIMWTNASTGRTYILSGPLSKEQLMSMRKTLPPGVR